VPVLHSDVVPAITCVLQRLSSKVAMLCQHSKDHASKYDASAQEAIPDWENAIEATAVLIQQFLAKLTFTE
jgi:hypothetical protein